MFFVPRNKTDLCFQPSEQQQLALRRLVRNDRPHFMMEVISYSTPSGTPSQRTTVTVKSSPSPPSPSTSSLEFESRPVTPNTDLHPEPSPPYLTSSVHNESSFSLAPASPSSVFHIRLPGKDAPVYNCLSALLMNHLQVPILPEKQALKERLFKRSEPDREIYHADLSPLSEEVAQVELPIFGIYRLDHIEIDIITNKHQEGEFMVYKIEAQICMCDYKDGLLVIEAGKGHKDVGIFKSFIGNKEELVGACVRGQVRVKMERKPVYKSLKPWNKMHWITAVEWLRLLSKAQFDSFGEARGEREVKEVKKRMPEIAALRDPELLLDILLPLGKPDFASWL